MSVFTPVGRDALAAFLRGYSTGELQFHKGIGDGIETTSHFVTTDRCEMALTLFETQSCEEMGYFLDLMPHKSEQGVPGAHPVTA
jgi:homoserine kinase type II